MADTISIDSIKLEDLNISENFIILTPTVGSLILDPTTPLPVGTKVGDSFQLAGDPTQANNTTIHIIDTISDDRLTITPTVNFTTAPTTAANVIYPILPIYIQAYTAAGAAVDEPLLGLDVQIKQFNNNKPTLNIASLFTDGAGADQYYYSVQLIKLSNNIDAKASQILAHPYAVEFSKLIHLSSLSDGSSLFALITLSDDDTADINYISTENTTDLANGGVETTTNFANATDYDRGFFVVPTSYRSGFNIDKQVDVLGSTVYQTWVGIGST